MRWLVASAVLLVGTQCGFGAEPAAGSLKVLSNNVGIFPKEVLAFYPAEVKEKKQEVIADEQERAGKLARVLLDYEGDPDVVLLQEIWSIKARDRLIKDLAEKYPYVKHPESITNGVITIQAAGLMVFSKYPLSDFAFQEFTRGFGSDKQAQKGIVGVKLTKDGHKFAVFTTHLQAGGKRDPTVKTDQLRECNQFLHDFVGDEADVTALLAGDFNIRSTDPAAYGEIFTHLTGAHDSYRADLGPLTTTGRNPKQPDKRIDYLLTFGDAKATSTIVDPAGPKISDHLAVFGTVGAE